MNQILPQHIRAQGKLLLTGEYFVLDGAWALALPARFGQTLRVEAGDTPSQLHWESLEADGQTWFAAQFALPALQVITTTDVGVAATLKAMLMACGQQRPDFLSAQEGIRVTTQTDFPREWGLGTSSTLIAALSKWSGADAWPVLFNTLGGSGYDLACAFAQGPLLYRLLQGKPEVTTVHFSPPYATCLYFVYLGKKQDSREGIKRYRQLDTTGNSIWVSRVSQLTRQFLQAGTLSALEDVMEQHEHLVAAALDLTPVRTQHFPDYWGGIKSLGAWGGDFILVSSARPESETRAYFQERGFGTMIPWREMAG